MIRYLMIAVFFVFGVFLTSCVVDTATINQNTSPPKSINDNIYPPRVAANTFHNADESDLPDYAFGKWGGTGGGMMEIKRNVVKNVLDNKEYEFTIYEVLKEKDEVSYLLKLKVEPTAGYIKRYMSLKFINHGQLIYYGFDTYEDFKDRNIAGAGEFFKN